MKFPGLPLDTGELHELARMNTPTIYNGWELVTKSDPARDGFNREPLHDYIPHLGPMAGYAVTVVIEPGNPEHPKSNPKAWNDYREYLMSVSGPKIVVVQDLDKPSVIGAFWGEVGANLHKAVGCVGTIVDGAIRDVDEMAIAGFKALARCLCVGHAHSCPIRWNCEVEVFGRRVQPGQLIHADKHGFLAVPFGEEAKLLEAARYADSIECRTKIAASRDSTGRTMKEILSAVIEAGGEYDAGIRAKYSRGGVR